MWDVLGGRCFVLSCNTLCGPQIRGMSQRKFQRKRRCRSTVISLDNVELLGNSSNAIVLAAMAHLMGGRILFAMGQALHGSNSHHPPIGDS